MERSNPKIIMSSFACHFNSLAKIERFLREDSQIDFTMHNVKWGWEGGVGFESGRYRFKNQFFFVIIIEAPISVKNSTNIVRRALSF